MEHPIKRLLLLLLLQTSPATSKYHIFTTWGHIIKHLISLVEIQIFFTNTYTSQQAFHCHRARESHKSKTLEDKTKIETLTQRNNDKLIN